MTSWDGMIGSGYDAREFTEIHTYLLQEELAWSKYILIRDIVLEWRVVTIGELGAWSAMRKYDVLRYLPLLQDYEEIHLSKFRGRQWFVHATEAEARLCRRRHLSLMLYARLRPLTPGLRREFEDYYARTLDRQWRVPEAAMRDLKKRWASNISSMIRRALPSAGKSAPRLASNFIRTVQDLVLMELGEDREYVTRVLETSEDLEVEADEMTEESALKVFYPAQEDTSEGEDDDETRLPDASD
jgi:hypothetical protein